MKNFILSSTKKIKYLALSVLMLVCTVSIAQNYTVTFQDETIEMPENITSFQWSDMPDYAMLRDGYIGWVQFYETPTQDVQDFFKANGLNLVNYIQNHTYLFRFPASTSVDVLKNNGVRSIVPVEGRFRLAQNLKNGIIEDWAVSGDNLLVTLQYYPYVNENYVIQELAEKQITVIENYDTSNNLALSIPNNCLEELSQLPFVKWVEFITAPSIKDDDRGRALHRAGGLDTETVSGRNYTGEGVGVMCRDDGSVGDHIDFQGRISGLVGNNGNNNTHGDGVSGIMAGAGNRNPRNRGMAAGSDLYVVQYNSNFLDNATNNLINDGSVQITNSSYSNGCNAGYTSVTETVDSQTIDNPELLHVFSAGNSNNNNCGYGAGSQWGNITGGHKQGKNVIATANVFYDGSIVSSSSRGPAHDGRIKPDIAANGQNQISTAPNNGYLTFGGTSGAAPGIAGISAQLYQAYMETNGGAMPNSALIKAVLLNTANDYGNVGPDFKFGFGVVNALRAGILIEDGRHLTDDVSQGNTNTHTITVPAGTTQMRAMVYWDDPAASPGATTALVNDLDLVVTDPASATYLPYVLDSTPTPAALDTPATNGIDRLNNVEQVLINNPTAGTYDIDITGFNVPMGPQEYYVVYEIIAEELTVTHPNGSEKLLPNDIVPIHWDAYNTGSSFVVEYSDDNGATWNNIGTAPAGAAFLDWSVPGDFTGEGLVRVTSGAFQDVSDDNFSIAIYPTAVNIDRACEGELTFSWNAADNAEEYDLYFLGEKFMEVVGTTSDLTITVPVADIEDSVWYAVAAKNNTLGWESLRSTARNFAGGEFECEILGVEDFAVSNITLYPNPANDNVFINMGAANVNDVKIVVTNSLGQEMATINKSNLDGANQMAINVAKYATGLYFVTINANGQTITKKLLVK